MVGYVYILYDFKNKIARIGRTKNSNLNRPLSQVGYYPFHLFMFVYKVNNFEETELTLHRMFKKHKINGDWYNIKISDMITIINDNIDWLEFNAPSPKNILTNICKNDTNRRSNQIN